MRAARAGIALGFVAATALAGCVAEDRGPGRLTASIAFVGASHLDVTVANVGGEAASVGGENPLSLAGPAGQTPIHWSNMDAGRLVAPGERVLFQLHARLVDGVAVMSMDQAHGDPEHVAMVPGPYTLRIGSVVAETVLPDGMA